MVIQKKIDEKMCLEGTLVKLLPFMLVCHMFQSVPPQVSVAEGLKLASGFKPQGARRRAARLPFLSEKRETNSDLESEDSFHHIVFAFIMYTYIYTIQLKVLQHGFLKAILSKLNLV